MQHSHNMLAKIALFNCNCSSEITHTKIFLKKGDDLRFVIRVVSLIDDFWI